MRFVLLVLTLVVAIGCEFTIPVGRYPCNVTADCPPNQLCSAGLCVAMQMDATVPDGGSADGGDAGVDGSRVDGGPPPPCDPVAQTGCEAGEKCTTVSLITEGRRETRCAPAGTVGLLGSCTTATADGVENDDCAAGLFCSGQMCVPICSLEPDSCPTGFACGRYSSLFEDRAEPLGLCTETCDPVSQVRDIDGALACGSPDPSAPTRTCVGFGPFICVILPPDALDRVHGSPALGPFINGCAPGYMPVFTDPATGEAICGAFCRPQETHSGATAGAQGAPGSGFTCPDRGAPNAECRFVWLAQNESDPLFREFDQVGLCIDYQDRPHPTNPAEPWPSCTTLSSTDTDSNGQPDHFEWACAP